MKWLKNIVHEEEAIGGPNTCEGKLRRSQANAEKYLRQKQHPFLIWYRCRECGWCHIGHAAGSKSR